MAEKRGRDGEKKAAAPKVSARSKTSAAKKPVAKKAAAKKPSAKKQRHAKIQNRLHVAKRLQSRPQELMIPRHAVGPPPSQMALSVHWADVFFGRQCLRAYGDS